MYITHCTVLTVQCTMYIPTVLTKKTFSEKCLKLISPHWNIAFTFWLFKEINGCTLYNENTWIFDGKNQISCNFFNHCNANIIKSFEISKIKKSTFLFWPKLFHEVKWVSKKRTQSVQSFFPFIGSLTNRQTDKNNYYL